jgi:hypothetical protein
MRAINPTWIFSTPSRGTESRASPTSAQTSQSSPAISPPQYIPTDACCWKTLGGCSFRYGSGTRPALMTASVSPVQAMRGTKSLDGAQHSRPEALARSRSPRRSDAPGSLRGHFEAERDNSPWSKLLQSQRAPRHVHALAPKFRMSDDIFEKPVPPPARRRLRCGDKHAACDDLGVHAGYESRNAFVRQRFGPNLLGSLFRLRARAYFRELIEFEQRSEVRTLSKPSIWHWDTMLRTVIIGLSGITVWHAPLR